MSSSPAERSPASVLGALRSPKLLTVEVLGGLVTAFALIPESLSFAIVAGLDPMMGLYAAFTMACVTAVLGGRPGMVSGAAGSIALVVFPVARDHGVEYLLATVILGGVLQMVMGALGVAKLMRFIPRSVMVGFVDALAILIFSAQLQHLFDVPWLVYPLTAVGLLVIIGFPRLTSKFPAPLASILLITLAVVVFGWDVPTVGDQGELPSSFPGFGVPDVPLSMGTLGIIAPYAVALALVGLLESLLTAKLVDDLTDTHSDKTRESLGQGVANVVTGFFGGMGGCAMIGQTMINVKQAGARTRVSSFLAGAFLIVLSVSLSDVVGRIPMAALVAVMLVVAFTTFDWNSVRTLRVMPVSETVVLLVTVVSTVLTDNLAVGVILGVLTAMVAFARRVAHLTRVERVGDTGAGRYRVTGQLFFASSNDLVYQFDYAGDPAQVTVDFTDATVWDSSTVAALQGVREQYERRGKSVTFTGLDATSRAYVERLEGRLG
ncbi:MAG: SulP family inorganic anion transporter [Corynebacterium sp.]|uniref:SulP family inorganic anion transporter n=1 Tax=unclassified Corynebacterium TaxID=2624378 RepID=UPI00264A33A1|nr:SulP family inorganic anion transporter [Corynebacterium sp.]MDN5581877.1 SulP family inorganic anion transporter [Corynebacterium sp.]MDN5719079.1 SulP family inorganic anion transporter [Corynebacterium sp.]MDN6258618.1 SulP family inorganic anion transporter [Corynebacterium sp.]MDN6323862.1 SulP family inorganic anion transporter [Corynebacterium sp.]MDN6510412.1 SulP family inorganic anion transporter [Corynebacterium sp.]